MLKTSLDVAVNFFIHGFNSISCIVDIFIVRRDIKFWHLWYAIAYGLSYMVFSVIYWAAGGTGACRLVICKIMGKLVCPFDGQRVLQNGREDERENLRPLHLPNTGLGRQTWHCCSDHRHRISYSSPYPSILDGLYQDQNHSL